MTPAQTHSWACQGFFWLHEGLDAQRLASQVAVGSGALWVAVQRSTTLLFTPHTVPRVPLPTPKLALPTCMDGLPSPFVRLVHYGYW